MSARLADESVRPKLTHKDFACEPIFSRLLESGPYFNSATGTVKDAVFTTPLRWNCTQIL
jgi:hypothetical protein